MGKVVTESPKLDLDDYLIDEILQDLEEEKNYQIGVIRDLIPVRDAGKEEFQFHLEIGSNAYAMGDKSTWLLHKNRRERVFQETMKPLDEAKNHLATIIEKINPMADEKLRREGKLFVYTGKTLGDATKTVSYPAQSPEWHEQRAKGIGGSDIAAIYGFSPWTKREELFQIKTGQVVPDEKPRNAGALWRGNILEDYIAREYQENEKSLQLVHCKDSWKSKEREYHLANVDGLLYDNVEDEKPSGVLEIKTSSVPSSWVDGVPIYYRLQTLWYMSAFGLNYAKFAVMIDDVNYHEFEINPKPGEIEEMLKKVEEFVDEVNEWKKNH